MTDVVKLITQLVQVLDQASFNNIDTRGMNQVMSVRAEAARFVEAAAKADDKDQNGDDVPTAAE